MSGEPKPLTQMTPREAWEHAWEQAIDACRVFEEEAAAKQLEAVRNLGRQMLDQDQEEEGVPVVARDEAAELRAENARLREALEALLNADHRGVYDAAFRREAVAQAEALVAPGLSAAEREARALAAILRRYSTDERDLAAENRAAIAEQEHGWREA